MPEKAQFFESRKFMWDGVSYESEAEATEKKKTYEQDNFETRLVNGEDGKLLLYTRRVVTAAKEG